MTFGAGLPRSFLPANIRGVHEIRYQLQRNKKQQIEGRDMDIIVLY